MFPRQQARSIEAIHRWQSSAHALASLALACLCLAIASIAYAGITTALKTPFNLVPVSVATAHGMLHLAAGENAQALALGGDEMPGYPLVLAVIAQVIPGTTTLLACWTEGQGNCNAAGLAWIAGIQILVAVASLLLAYRLALTLSRNRLIAGLAVGLTFFAIRSGSFAGSVRGHIWYVFFLLLYLDLLVEAEARQSWRRALGSGAALGLSVLLEPLTAVLIPISAAQLFLVSRARVRSVGIGPWLAPVALLFAALTAALCPLWFAIAHGFEVEAIWRSLAAGLGERMAFTALERSSLFAGIVQPIPLLGDLVSGLLPASELKKFSIGAVPGSLAYTGREGLFAGAYARSGGSGVAAIAMLLREHMLGQPVAYLVSTVPVLMRGLFAGGGVIALAGLFHVVPMLRFARAEGRLGVHLLVVVPVAALLLVNVLFTGNAFWLNPMLPFVYAYAIAYVAGGW